MTIMTSFLWCVCFWCFLAIKAWGVTFAAWSWWWMLLPFVPFLGVAVQRLHL
jgi:hypothetical protein